MRTDGRDSTRAKAGPKLTWRPLSRGHGYEMQMSAARGRQLFCANHLAVGFVRPKCVNGTRGSRRDDDNDDDNNNSEAEPKAHCLVTNLCCCCCCSVMATGGAYAASTSGRLSSGKEFNKIMSTLSQLAVDRSSGTFSPRVADDDEFGNNQTKLTRRAHRARQVVDAREFNPSQVDSPCRRAGRCRSGGRRHCSLAMTPGCDPSKRSSCCR